MSTFHENEIATHRNSSNNNENNNNNSSKNKPLTNEWKSWLRLNLARGCAKPELWDRCVVQEGFSRDEVEAVMGWTKGNYKRGDSANDVENTDNDATINNTTTTTTALSKSLGNIPLNNCWKETIRLKLDQGVDKEELFLYCLKEGLILDQVCDALGGYRARSFCLASTPKLPFMKRTFTPRAWKLDTDLVDMYEIPNFLTDQECQEIMELIDQSVLERSTVTAGDAATRTSRTCHLRLSQAQDNRHIIARVESKLQRLMGMDYDMTHAEPLQGQVYDVGNEFQAHTDWFEPNSPEYEQHAARKGGQRTWTVLMYLNAVQGGGGTCFSQIERTFQATPGLALVWNNLDADDQTPNPWTLHQAMPVLQGKKYVLTKWFRQWQYSGAM